MVFTASSKLGRWLGHQDRAFINGICAPRRGYKRGRCSLSLSCEDTANKMVICKPGIRLSPDTTTSASILINFASSRTMRKGRLSFEPPSGGYLWYLWCGICHSSPNSPTQAHGPNPACPLFWYSSQEENYFSISNDCGGRGDQKKKSI